MIKKLAYTSLFFSSVFASSAVLALNTNDNSTNNINNNVAAISPELLTATADTPQPQSAALDQAGQFIINGEPLMAIKVLDGVIGKYESTYHQANGRADSKVFSARSRQEALYYALQSASENSSAQIASGEWIEALYLKAFSLIELKQIDQAAAVLNKAIKLAPQNARLYNERGHIYQLLGDFTEADTQFSRAVAAAEFSPDDLKIIEQTRGLRGMGYVAVEQGRLNDAKDLYQQSLQLDPNDEKSKMELAYIEQMRQQTRH